MAENEQGGSKEPPAEGRQARRSRARTIDIGELFDALQPVQVAQAKTLVNSVNMAFVLIPAGSFQMGTPESELGYRTNEYPVHEVVFSSAFYCAIHPVTQWAFQAVTGQNPSRFTPASGGGGPDHPVENISWNAAVNFCQLLTNRPEECAAGRSYRLPSEAEWEYACRAGTNTPYGHGLEFLGDQGNRGAKPDAPKSGTTPVTKHPASAWGLHDMHGNVWEWCADWYGEGYYKQAPLRDPNGPREGRFRVLRGGSWRNQPDKCRAGYRNALAPHEHDSATGFRVVMVMAGG